MEFWKKDADRIRQVTGLPIVCMQTTQSEHEMIRAEREENGWELVCASQENDTAWLVMIESRFWHESARSFLGLFFSQQESASSLPEQVASWLRGIADGNPSLPPARLEQQWHWKEGRVCFLIERCRIDSSFEWSVLQPLLQDFYKESHTAFFSAALGHLYLLLSVPLSMLGNQSDSDSLLEWASGLHDLISTELMENVRIIAGQPIATPSSLGKSLSELLALSHALQRYRPKIMVAGCWHYPLERWADSLPEDMARAVLDSIHSMIPMPSFSSEQMETLETLFSRQLNVSETARQLFIHRNTLLYRLDKLTEQTGMDPRLFPDAVLLQLSLLFRQK